MKRLLAHKWVRVVLGHVFGLGTVVLIISSASLLLGSACPTYWMLGICCPFCGMTRAHLAAMRLDFAAAFYYHPVFFTGVPMIWKQDGCACFGGFLLFRWESYWA